MTYINDSRTTAHKKLRLRNSKSIYISRITYRIAHTNKSANSQINYVHKKSQTNPIYEPFEPFRRNEPPFSPVFPSRHGDKGTVSLKTLNLGPWVGGGPPLMDMSITSSISNVSNGGPVSRMPRSPRWGACAPAIPPPVVLCDLESKLASVLFLKIPHSRNILYTNMRLFYFGRFEMFSVFCDFHIIAISYL